MGLVRTLVWGRENGTRARLRRRLVDLWTGTSTPEPVLDVVPPPPPRPTVPEPPRDVTPPEGFEVVLHKDALPPGSIKEVIVAGTSVAIANVGGELWAITNTCPHAETPLGEGRLEGSVLTCAGHGWTFDVTTGACLTNPDVTLARYEARLLGDAICVRV